ncbi:MAG TPA: hypothetical protein VH682_23500 [Gemmataceae bacterium]|jgi:hypothetical protein
MRFTGAPAVAQPVMLTSTIVVGAFMAGFGAARMVTGQRDKNLLWYAVEQALGQPSRPGTALKVSNARNAQDVVAMTTGEMLHGVPVMPTADPAPGRPPASRSCSAIFMGSCSTQVSQSSTAGRIDGLRSSYVYQ